jgi:hypothetical protein
LKVASHQDLGLDMGLSTSRGTPFVQGSFDFRSSIAALPFWLLMLKFAPCQLSVELKPGTQARLFVGCGKQAYILM